MRVREKKRGGEGEEEKKVGKNEEGRGGKKEVGGEGREGRTISHLAS